MDHLDLCTNAFWGNVRLTGSGYTFKRNDILSGVITLSEMFLLLLTAEIYSNNKNLLSFYFEVDTFSVSNIWKVT